MRTTTETPGGDEFAALCRHAWDTLIPPAASPTSHPTTTRSSTTVAQRTEHTGSLGKTDIAALVVWKRLSAQTRWVTDLMSLPDTHVRAVTERAVTAVRDTTVRRSKAARTGRGIIWELPGFRTGDALASVILTAAAPQRMAVYDRRVQHALDTLGLPLTPTPGHYGRYLQLLDDLLHHGGAHANGWTARDIDTALYWIGANPHTTRTTQQAADQHKPAPSLLGSGDLLGTISNTTPPLSRNPQ
ncbi:hypothetical protein [Streptomyces sp. CA-251251]|uniref:hypothetical protein n=1 Tax=Streptomyces sp. CA-251251 TaxID=3240063 RepID=UPI003D89E049